MDDRKTTLYLAVLCIILMIWGSVLDGKRLHLKEVLEAENAELVHLVNETRASYAKAASTQEELQKKLEKLQEQLSALKKKNLELEKINQELKAELQKERELRQAAEKRSAEMKPASALPCMKQAAATETSFQVKELEARVQQLIRDREELQFQLRNEKQNAFAASLKITELESQLRYCRERMDQIEDDAAETRQLRSRIRELETQLAERTQELWNTRLSLSADLDACTRQLMKAAAAPSEPPSVPPCKAKMEQGPGPKPGCGKCQKCAGCTELKKLKMQLDACSARLDSLQKEFKESGMRYLEEISQLKKAITGAKPPQAPVLKKVKPIPPPTDLKVTSESDEIKRLKKEIQEKEKELEQYKKNTEALLEQIRQQRAQIKKLKAGK